MRRILRIFVNALTILSALGCAATAWSWTESFGAQHTAVFHAVDAPWRGGKWAVTETGLVSHAGQVRVGRARAESVNVDNLGGWRVGQNLGTLFNTVPDQHGALGFGWVDSPRSDTPAYLNTSGTILTIPHWALLVIFALLPTASVRRQLRRQRDAARAARCPACGYDLRATPDRCPECGTIPAPCGAPSASSPTR